MSVNDETVLKVLATATFTADLRLAGGKMLGQTKKLTGVKVNGMKLVAEDVTFFSLPARVDAIVIRANGDELVTIPDIVDDKASPVGGDLLVPLSSGFMGE